MKKTLFLSIFIFIQLVSFRNTLYLDTLQNNRQIESLGIEKIPLENTKNDIFYFQAAVSVHSELL